jgi:ABC-2 type transport system ATP-binding protein
MLEICHLTKRYQGITAVDDVSFTIRPGEILGYIGPNGAGKSTTVKMIVGLFEPSDGQILFDGRSTVRRYTDRSPNGAVGLNDGGSLPRL